MSVLFGHPTGNPNSHQAALAHFEAGRLEAFCVPWMPTPRQLHWLGKLPFVRALSSRLQRRCFEALLHAPRIEGYLGELSRMVRRAAVPRTIEEKLAYEANDWLMRTMTAACERRDVSAVHSYEDCSLLQFQSAKRQSRACLYDLPIGYYQAWHETQSRLAERFSDWLPAGGLPSSRWVRPEQKRLEMELADLVLVPSVFVKNSISRYFQKKIAVATYGVDVSYWRPRDHGVSEEPLRFIYVGQCSLRKGTPLLLEAWKRAALPDASLRLVGGWQLSKGKRTSLPENVTWVGPMAADGVLREFYGADVFVFPSYFEGRALAVGEALASGLPVICSDASGWAESVGAECGRVFGAGDIDMLIESLRWLAAQRDRLPQMKEAARAKAVTCTWESYRRSVSDAVAPYL